ncbi:OLC1v1016370C3 [Oldenlandia corymbosa var. corymbosa]|uniref:OLC1v1016370C3 n=1 Tax=Oldenlandia corymbosa var. corymbosa TaxID=529605 RepID=A0AAV1E7E4_OLDCO|nr:OLC1v1016370C3 [Oldenlandia corymbosa var. corymbosa]
MAFPGGPRPGNMPPNYNPNVLANNMQNLQLNRPNQPPSGGNLNPNAPRQTTPFSQQPPTVPGANPVPRPGPPPIGAFPRGPVPPSGPPQSSYPSNLAAGRPTGPPPMTQAPPPFPSRPPPPGVTPSVAGSTLAPPRPTAPSLAGSAVPPPPGAAPASGFGPRPGPAPSGPAFPPSDTSGATSNGPPAFGSGPMQVGAPGPSSGIAPRFPPAGGPPRSMAPPGTPFHPTSMRSPFGSPPATAVPSPALPTPPFSVPPGTSPFAAPVQGVHTPSGPPYATQPWQIQPPGRMAPPPPISGPGQPPRMYMPPPGLGQPMTSMTSGAGMAGSSKIDPNQIPRPIPGSSVILHETRQGNQANFPPPATSDYIVRDTGNCSPRYMRCTINQVPCTVDLLNTSAMQMALLVQPLALPHPSEEPIHIVDFGESGPVRCFQCKAYINPFMKFIDQGRHFICNLCGAANETPRDYQCNLGPDGRRRDADERPELCRGTVEFVATKEFTVRDPMPAVYFFLIDVSLNAIQTGATAAACSAISQVIGDLPEGPRTMVGIATFDSTIHFYNLKCQLQQPMMLVVPDVQDVYTPLQTDVVVQLSECRDHLELLLETIPTMFQNNRTSDSSFGAAVKAAFLAVQSTGGKLLVFQSVLPSVGIGALSAREAEGRTNISAGEKEAHKLLQPVDKTLKTMAIEFAEYQVCVDLFITAQTYVDIASVSVIPRTTGGQVYYYYPFSAISDPAKLANDLRWNIARPQGFEAVMRVRCSMGLEVQDYFGNFCKRIPTDVDLPAIDCDKTIMVTLKHVDKLQDGSECAFQSALLYTTVYGQRRIRVSTLSLPCTTMLSNLFRSADLDTQFACVAKQVANEIPSTSLVHMREQVNTTCINILHSYRKFCATVQSSTGQLILPEALKLLPLYVLALNKSTGLRTDGRIDDRSFWINKVAPLSIPLTISLVYPRMIAIHNLGSKESEGDLIPPTIPLSSEHVSDDGIYLLENGEDCLIYVGGSVDQDLLKQLLGITSLEEVPSQFVLQQLDNPLSKKLNAVMNEIRRQRCSYLRYHSFPCIFFIFLSRLCQHDS